MSVLRHLRGASELTRAKQIHSLFHFLHLFFASFPILTLHAMSAVIAQTELGLEVGMIVLCSVATFFLELVESKEQAFNSSYEGILSDMSKHREDVSAKAPYPWLSKEKKVVLISNLEASQTISQIRGTGLGSTESTTILFLDSSTQHYHCFVIAPRSRRRSMKCRVLQMLGTTRMAESKNQIMDIRWCTLMLRRSGTLLFP